MQTKAKVEAAATRLLTSLKTARITKKQQYINGLEHDLKFLREQLAKKSIQAAFWWQGQLTTKLKARGIISELQAELNKIELDKTYKPWKNS